MARPNVQPQQSQQSRQLDGRAGAVLPFQRLPRAKRGHVTEALKAQVKRYLKRKAERQGPEAQSR